MENKTIRIELMKSNETDIATLQKFAEKNGLEFIVDRDLPTMKVFSEEDRIPILTNEGSVVCHIRGNEEGIQQIIEDLETWVIR